MTLRRHHDMGGLASGEISTSEHEYQGWEKKVDAIIKTLSAPGCGLLSTDELRRGIEELGPGVYDELDYYERWITSATNILIEKGIINTYELGVKMAEIEKRWRKDRQRKK